MANSTVSANIVKLLHYLYNAEVLTEEVIIAWYNQSSAAADEQRTQAVALRKQVKGNSSARRQKGLTGYCFASELYSDEGLTAPYRLVKHRFVFCLITCKKSHNQFEDDQQQGSHYTVR